MSKLDSDTVRKQINRVTHKSFDFWLVNCQNDYRNLLSFIESVDLQAGSEIFTSEGVYPGAELLETPFEKVASVGSCGSAPVEEVVLERERSLLIDYAKELQNSLARKRSTKTPIGKIMAHTRKRPIRLWLGAPHLDFDGTRHRLYNAYLLIENGEIQFVHRKKFLWDGEDSEVGVFESAGTDRRAPISVTEYDGIFENRAILICQEADAFYCPKWSKRPTHIPEVRRAKPNFVIIPAHWANKQLGTEEAFLRRIGLAVARRIREPIDKFSAVRRNGALVCVINYNSAYVCGPVDEKKIKARVYAQQPDRGWLRINNHGITIGDF